jgi:hypothetical protein
MSDLPEQTRDAAQATSVIGSTGEKCTRKVHPMTFDRNTKLMKSMGSPTGKWNPEAPDQNLFVLNQGKEAVLVVAAWVKAHTSERIPGSPFCVDQKGKPVYIQKLADDVGWELQSARNELAQAEAAGLCRVEKMKIWQCADIPLAHQKRIANGRTKEKQTNSVQSCFSGQLLDSIERLPAEKRDWIEARCGEYLKWRPTLFSDGQAALRTIDERLKDSILRGVGLEKKVSGKERKNARKPAAAQLKVDLVLQPNFVQSYAEDTSVQSTEATSVQVANDDASFMYSDSLLQTTTTDAPTAAGAPSEELVVVAMMGITEKRARRFLLDCRTAYPGCTIEDILEVIDHKVRGFHRGIQNPTGLLLTSVPERLLAAWQERSTQGVGA